MKQKVIFDWKAPMFGLLCAMLLNTVGLWSAIFPGLIQNYQAPQWAMVLSQVVSQWSRGMWLAFFPAVVALWMLYSRREGRPCRTSPISSLISPQAICICPTRV